MKRLMLIMMLMITLSFITQAQSIRECGKDYIKIEGKWYWNLGYTKIAETPPSQIKAAIPNIKTIPSYNSSTATTDNTKANEKWAKDMAKLTPKPVYQKVDRRTVNVRVIRPKVVTRVKSGNTITTYRY